MLLLLLAEATAVYGQACPRGVRYNCVWGCGRHTDLSGDGYCDYSFLTDDVKAALDSIARKREQKEGVSDTTAIEPGTATATDVAKEPALTEKKEAESGVEPKREADRGTGLRQEGLTPEKDQKKTLTGAAEAADEMILVHPPTASHDHFPHGPVYNLILISSITLGLYFLTFILYKRKVITRIHHRKFWNLMLLLTFIVSCLFGVFMVVQLNYDVALKIYPTLLLWHVEVGIAMSLIAIIHILWHIRYFRNMFRKW